MANPECFQCADCGNQQACEPFAQAVLEAVVQVIEEEKVEGKEKKDGN